MKVLRRESRQLKDRKESFARSYKRTVRLSNGAVRFKEQIEISFALQVCYLMRDPSNFFSREDLIRYYIGKMACRVKALITPGDVILEWIFSSIRLAHLIS